MSLEPPLPTKVNPSKALSSDPKYAPLTSGDTTVDGWIQASIGMTYQDVASLTHRAVLTNGHHGSELLVEL